MRLDDFVMLGKTIPEPNSDGRVFVCSAGASPEMRSLVRLYPLARRESPSRWSRSRVHVERNPRDSRMESFQIAGDRSQEGHDEINGRFDVVGSVARPHRDSLLASFVGGSIKSLNASRKSLAVIQAVAPPRLHFTDSEQSPDSPQLSLFAQTETEHRDLGARRFAYQPRLEFCDEDGWHDLQLRDWGAYEFMRKHGNQRRHELRHALHLDNNPMMIVGNMNNQRTAWLVIAVLHPLRQDDLFATKVDSLQREGEAA
jgi:hypothetical protein